MTLAPGPSGTAEIRDDILADILVEASAAGVTEEVGPGSDNHIWATGMAGALALAHARIDSIEDAITPEFSEGDDLTRWQRALGLPDVPASPASGKLVLDVQGTDNIADGATFTIGALRGHVLGSWSVTDGSEVDVVMDVMGTVGNQKPGATAVFLNPPPNVQPEAKVSSIQPLTGGYNAETEERRRERVQNRLAFLASGGNWGQLRELAFNASPAVQQCFVYAALGGPSTTKVVVARSFDRENFDFTRQMPEGGLSLVRSAIHQQISSGITIPVQSVVGQQVMAALLVTLPPSAQAGGNGEGWSDLAPWPLLVSQDYVTVSSINSSGVVTCDADTTVAPVVGQTHVAWWSPNDMKFHVRTIIGQSGSSGAWVLTPDAPWVDSRGLSPNPGDFLSPASENMASYGLSWLAEMERLGPGENTSDVQLIGNGRSLRKPTQGDGGARIGLTSWQLQKIQQAHPEIDDIAYSYRSLSTPAVPGSVATAPNVLIPYHFGIYST